MKGDLIVVTWHDVVCECDELSESALRNRHPIARQETGWVIEENDTELKISPSIISYPGDTHYEGSYTYPKKVIVSVEVVKRHD